MTARRTPQAMPNEGRSDRGDWLTMAVCLLIVAAGVLYVAVGGGLR